MTGDLATKKLALAVLQSLIDAGKKQDKLRSALREVWPDVDGVWIVVPEVETAALSLVDSVLGDEVGSYLILECWRKPGRIIRDGVEYPIGTVADVAAYCGVEL
jgi:hypothetical protein